MRLRTIWTLSGATLADRIDRTKDTLSVVLADLLPKRIAFWAYIRTGSKAMLPNEIVPDAKFVDLIDRIPRGRNH